VVLHPKQKGWHENGCAAHTQQGWVRRPFDENIDVQLHDPRFRKMLDEQVRAVRETQSWPRSWASCSCISAGMHGANLHLLGQPEKFLAAAVKISKIGTFFSLLLFLQHLKTTHSVSMQCKCT
jgi:hypothetical protein